MISPPLGIPKRSTPLHIFTIERVDGTIRRIVIPGGYSQFRRDRAEAKLKPGDRIVSTTWRSDWRYLDHPPGGGDYSG